MNHDDDHVKAVLRQLRDSGGGIQNFPGGLKLRPEALDTNNTGEGIGIMSMVHPDGPAPAEETVFSSGSLEVIEVEVPGVLWLATLQDTHTGEIKVIREMFANGFPDETVDFIWNEGNYGCDCNRYGMFYPDDDVQWACNFDTQRFVLLILEKATSGT